MAHAFQVEPFQYLQGLEVDRALAPRAAGVDLDSLVINRGRRINSDAERRQVFHCEQPALFLDEADHFLGYLALVEEVAGGLQSCFPSLPGVVAFHFNEAAESAGQVLLHQDVANIGATPTGEENGRGGRPASVAVGVADERIAGAG